MPAMLLVIAALLQLPVSIAALLAIIGYYLMVGAVVGHLIAIIPLVMLLAALATAIGIRYIQVGLYLPFNPKTAGSSESTESSAKNGG